MEDAYAWTALRRAAQEGHLNVVQFLASDCGADVNAMHRFGQTALMHAAEEGHLAVVRFLVNDCGANVNAENHDGWSALTRAASECHLDAVRCLVNDCGADTNKKTSWGLTALMLAADGGCLDVVRILVTDGGADVNMDGEFGRTALMLAAGGGHLGIVRILLYDSDADINTEDNTGETTLMKAAEGGHFDVVWCFVTDGDANVNLKNNYGESALMMAGFHGHLDVVRFLVHDCAAEADMKNNDGESALMNAAFRGHLDVMMWLVSDGSADVNMANNKGESALILAAFQGHLHIRNIGGEFLAKGLDADAVVKLFLPDASHSTLEEEVRVWQQLRHPNVLKLYGVCPAGPSVNFFVCEYANRGSLAEYTGASIFAGNTKPPQMWKYLLEAALGLEYLHERGIVHGDLRCSNILIGSDSLAKLSNFGLTRATKALSSESAESGKRPWSMVDDSWVRFANARWNSFADGDPYSDGGGNPGPSSDFKFVSRNDPYFIRRSRELVWQMCCRDPHQRPSLPSIVYELERLAIEERADNSTYTQPDLEPTCSFEEYRGGRMMELWLKLEKSMDESDNDQHRQLFDQTKHIYECFLQAEQNERLLEQFYSLLIDAYQTVNMSPEEARLLQLSSTRATTTSMLAFRRRVDTLLRALGESGSEAMETSWEQHRGEQVCAFLSGIADTVLLLQRMTSVEEKSALK